MSPLFISLSFSFFSIFSGSLCTKAVCSPIKKLLSKCWKIKKVFKKKHAVCILGFIKITEYHPTDTPTTYHLPINPPTTYPPTHRPCIMNLRYNRDQILNMFSIVKFLKTFIIIYFLNKQIIL